MTICAAGRPTCHRAYDEATAILVGDALQALAFSVLADETLGHVAPATRLAMIKTLALAAGTAGMAGGQAVDLAAVGQTLSVDAVENMHRRKTGALIKGSVLLGALGAGIDSGAASSSQLARCSYLVTRSVSPSRSRMTFSTSKAMRPCSAKPPARTRRSSKPTYPSTVGLPAARDRARGLRDRAIAALAPLGARNAPLVELAQFVVSRIK